MSAAGAASDPLSAALHDMSMGAAAASGTVVASSGTAAAAAAAAAVVVVVVVVVVVSFSVGVASVPAVCFQTFGNGIVVAVVLVYQ